MNIKTFKVLKKILRSGGVAIIPTDTIYGIVGQALNRKTVERIYSIKKRTPSKPLIILISSKEQLGIFGIKINSFQKEFLQKYWPGKLSAILPCFENQFDYLTRGTKTLAFRLPQSSDLIDLIKETGPLVAPSANPEGQKPAENLKEAKKYFDKEIDYYFGEGNLSGNSSTIVRLWKNKFEILRQGEVKIS